MEDVISEISDRERRKNDIILFNVTEPDKSVAEQTEKDKSEVVNILRELAPDVRANDIKPIRFGSFSDSRVRPNKITLQDY
nr:unnamed protein product [Callosobruchus analis]